MPAAAEFILYVCDQARARAFYAAVLGCAPSLDVPGMTEFDLDGATLGLMPAAGIERLLGAAVNATQAPPAPRCEVYLRRGDAQEVLQRALAAGARAVSPLMPRPWGECAGYVLDPDGYVLAVAEWPGSSDEAAAAEGTDRADP